MTSLKRALRGAGLAAIACCALLLVSCSSDVTPRAIPASGETAASSTTSTTTRSSAPTGLEGEDTGGDVDIDVEIGECVELGGTVDDATIDNATCGSTESNYKVIAKAPSNDQCVADADQYYYETFGGIEQGALCLDIDWVVDGCMELGGEDPKRAECASPGTDTVRVVEILTGTSEVDDCALDANRGFTYTERNFVVCLQDQ